jgi:hypothetical protein
VSSEGIFTKWQPRYAERRIATKSRAQMGATSSMTDLDAARNRLNRTLDLIEEAGDLSELLHMGVLDEAAAKAAVEDYLRRANLHK